MSITVNLPTADYIRKKFDLNVGGDAQKLIDSEVLRLATPYVPMDTSDLIKSGIQATVTGSGEVRYNAPYAHAHYYAVGWKWQGAPVRGDRWIEKMKTDGGVETLLKSLRYYMRSVS